MTAVVRFWLTHQSELATLTAEHVLLVVISTAIAAAIGLPLAIFATRHPRLASPLVAITSAVQTLPAWRCSLSAARATIGGVGARAALRSSCSTASPIVRSTILASPASTRRSEPPASPGHDAGQLLRCVGQPLALPAIVSAAGLAAAVMSVPRRLRQRLAQAGSAVIYRGLSMVDTRDSAGAVPAAPGAGR